VLEVMSLDRSETEGEGGSQRWERGHDCVDVEVVLAKRESRGDELIVARVEGDVDRGECAR
jgi:hypothetical protein